jgi:predicted NAD/FAD-binding protein
MRKKLAIVGSGISAMTVAHYLRDDFDISIFDKNNYLGGHTHTHSLEEEGKKFTIDTGFIVFNNATYPNLIKMFDELGVKKRDSNMSFAVSNLNTGLEYAGTSFDTLFAQRKNIWSLNYWKFLRDIKKFFKFALEDFEKIKGSEENLKEYCERRGLSEFFLYNYLAPMSAAVWSVPQKEASSFPIALLLPFFYNHGLLSMNGQHQWYTVLGGSNTYTKKIVENANFDIYFEEAVVSGREQSDKVELVTEKSSYKYDFVVLASHSNESRQIAKDISKEKSDILKYFEYNENLAVLHSDESAMPKAKKVWSAWNQIIGASASTVYWVNKLQNIPINKNYFISINPFREIDEDKIIKKIKYFHPHFTTKNFALQDKLSLLNQNTRIFFAGAYFGYGFHEDGVKAGLEVVKKLKKKI